MVVIFNLQNSHLLTLPRPTEEVFQVNGQNRPVANLRSSCRFSFSAERNFNTKATEQATFGFYFSVLVFFLFQESLNHIVCQRYGFFSVLAAIIRESSEKQHVLRIVKACCSFISLTEWRQRRVTYKQLISYINTLGKKSTFFSRVLLRLFSGPEIHVEHRSLCYKRG